MTSQTNENSRNRDVTNVFFITSASHGNTGNNQGNFQRAWSLSRDPNVRLTLIGRKNADFSYSVLPETQIVHARFSGMLGLILVAIHCALFRKSLSGGDARKCVILTEPSIINITGPLFKLFWRCRWVVDVWDIPIRNVDCVGFFQKLKNSFKKRLIRWCFRFADQFVLSIRPEFEFRYFRVPSQKVHCFCNAIFLNENRPTSLSPVPRGEEPLSIIYIRSVYTKIMGLDLLSDAFCRLMKTRPNCHLTIVGKIPESIEEQVAALRPLSNVEFLPPVPFEELQTMVQRTHVMVVPFRKVTDLEQTYPIKIFEGMAGGAVLVVPELAGLTAVIHHEQNGLVYDADSSEALTETLERLYDDDLLRMQMAEKAYQDVNQYDVALKNQSIIQLLRNEL